MPIRIPAEVVGLERSIQQQAQKAGRNLKINLGTSARSVDALAQPLGRITGKADEFTKSMEAANARVLAFGASVAVINGVTQGFKALVTTTIEVEKSLANINSILKQNTANLDRFKKEIFEVARNTEQTFQATAEAALELSRQGLSATEVTKRLNDSLVLARLSGLNAADSVSGLTAAINAFNSTGISSAEVLNKISAAAASAAVSDRDLIEALKRSGSVAVTTGVAFDDLVGIVAALQEKTARGGSVIGNSLKTIFTRITTLDKLKTLENLGVQTTDLSGEVLAANKIIENLSTVFAKLSRVEQVNLADKLVGKFQIAPFLALLQDYNSEIVRSNEVAQVSFNATNEAYVRNAALNQTLAAAVNEATINVKELANTLGEIGVTDSLRNILGFFNGLITRIKDILEGEGVGGDFARGIVKGLSKIISGPGLAIFGAIIAKLTVDLAKFGVGSLKTFFGLNKAAQAQAQLQGQIASTLLNNSSIQKKILEIENTSLSIEQKRALQAKFFTDALNTQLGVMRQMQGIAATIAPSVLSGTGGGTGRGRSAAGGFLPIGAERSDIARGVGGAPSSARPVVIPNFAFGGGRVGPMVANTSEYIVPNYAGGGDAIFNQNMAGSMGLPSNAKKVRASKGYIPNFATLNPKGKYVMLHGERGGFDDLEAFVSIGEDGKPKYNTDKRSAGPGAEKIRIPTYGLPPKGEKRGMDINEFIQELEDYSFEKSLEQAKQISKGKMPIPPPKENALKGEVNRGALSGFAGSLFELTLATLLTDQAFLEYASLTDTSNFDLDLKGQDSLLELYKVKGKPSFGEVKGKKNNDNILSTAAKIYRVLGPKGEGAKGAQKSKIAGKNISKNDAIKLGLIGPDFPRGSYVIKKEDLARINTQLTATNQTLDTRGRGPVRLVPNAAGGYIPNFSALDDAVSRERSAGLPISQIRINQSGKLRNSANPMGLAVTNTRDEPRGTIPNFQRRSGADGLEEGAKDATGKLIGLSLASSVLSTTFGTVSEEASGVTKFLGGLGEGITKVISTLTLLQALGINVANPLSAQGKAELKEQGEDFAERFSGFGGRARELGSKLEGAGSERSRLGKRGGSITTTFGKTIGGVGKLMGGLGKVVGRLIPFIGPLVIGFQAINAIFPKFGEGLKKLGTGILQTIGFIDTPAEKAAKALNKLADSAIAAAIEAGDFSDKAAQGLIDVLTKNAAEARARTKLKEADVDLDEVEQGEARAALLNRRFQDAAFTRENVGLRRVLQTQASVDEIVGAEGEGGFDINYITKARGLTGTEQSEFLRRLQKSNQESQDLNRLVGLGGVVDEGNIYGGLNIAGQRINKITADQNEQIERLTQAVAISAADEGQRRKLFDPSTSDAQFKNISDTILGNLPEDLKNLLQTGIIDLLTKSDTDAFEKLKQLTKETVEETKELTKEEKSLIAVAKSRLALELKFRDAKRTAFDVVSDQLKIESQLTSTTRVRRSSLENEIKLLQAQDKILGEAANKVTTDLSAGLFSDDAQKENKGKLNEITALIDQVNLAMRSGEEISEDQLNNFENTARELGLGKEGAKKFREELVNQRNVSLKLLSLEDAKIKKAALLKSIIEAQNAAYERNLDALQRSLTATSDLAAVESRLEEARADSRIAQLEAQKVGVGNTAQRGINAQITEVRRNQAIAQAGVADRRILEELRSSIFQAVRQSNPEFATRELRDRLTRTDTEGGFNTLIRELNERDKKARVEEIRKNFEEAKKANEILNTRINATNLFASSAQIFASAVNSFGLTLVNEQLRGVHSTLPEFLKLSERRRELEAEGAAGVPTFKPVPTVDPPSAEGAAEAMRAVAGAAGFLEGSLQDVKKAELERAIVTKQLEADLIRFDTTLKEAGASAKTFGNLLRDLFLNLDEAIASNIFNIRTGDDINSIINQGIDLRRNQRLLRGPASVGTVNEADRAARRERFRLRSGAAGTFAERFDIEKEFEITEELFELRDKMNEEGKSAEQITLALVERKLELERKRTSLGEALAKKLLKSEDELFTAFNEGSADAVLAFSDGLQDGIRNAIQGTGDLKDALLGAVTAFNNKLLDTALNSIFGGISNSIGSAFGIQTANKGGMINGGSGRRDDVPALLTGGEFVVNRESVQKYGRGFFEMLNAGTVQGFQQGGFFAPGLFGQGPISGKDNLLDFATQAFTTGDRDVIFGGGNVAAIGLEPESVRLSSRGRRMGTPSQRATQDAKAQAFDLFIQQGELEERLREQERQRKRALRNQLLLAGVSILGASMIQGGIAANRAAVSNNGKASVGTFVRGMFGGGVGSDNQRYGGLLNMFSGGFRGFKSGPDIPRAIPVRGATGGLIPPAAGMDTVGAMLNGSEFVMNTQATNTVGAGNLTALNAGASSFVTEDTAEDLNQRLLDKLDEVVESSGSGMGDINITVNSNGQQVTEGGEQGGERNQNLARQIRDAVVNVIEQEKRLGGSLRRGLA